MVPFLIKQTQKTTVMCAIDWSLMGMKQFLYAIHQHSEKSIDIHCKVSFGFKYIYAKPENVLRTTAMCVNQINLCMCNTHLSLPYQSSKGMQ